MSNTLKSTTVLECIRVLNEVALVNQVTLRWVPGHSDVEGNEIADLLAKQSANLHDSYISKVPIPLPIAKLKIQELGERK